MGKMKPTPPPQDEVDLEREVEQDVADERLERSLADMTCESVGKTMLDFLLTRLRTMSKPWAQMSESDQRYLIDVCDQHVRSVVREVVGLVSSEQRPYVLATLDQVLFKDGIKAVLTASKSSEFRHELADMTGSDVLIIIAEATPLMEGMDGIQPDPAQQQLPMDGDDAPVFDNTDMGKAA